MLFVSAQSFFWKLLCRTTSTTTHSLGKTVNLVRLLPLQDQGTAIRYKLVQLIRLLLLSSLFKTYPKPPIASGFFYFPSIFIPKLITTNLIALNTIYINLKFTALNTILQQRPLPWTPDWLLTCPSASYWYFDLVSSFTHTNRAPNPANLLFPSVFSI